MPIKYLKLREDGRSRHYYVRMTAPTAIQHLLPKSEIQYRESTRTADLRRANVIGAAMIAAKLKEWNALHDQLSDRVSSPAVLSQPLIDQLAANRLHSWLFSDDDERWSDSGLNDEELQAIEAYCETTDGQMRSILAKGKGSQEWRAVVEMVLEWCDIQGHTVSVTDPMFPQLVRAFARVEQRAQQFIVARNRGDVVEVPVPAPVVVGEPLSAIVEPFVKYKTPTVNGPKPVSMAVSIWQKFVEFKGDVVFDELTSRDIYNFIDARLYASVKPWSQGYVDGHVKRCLREIFSFARTNKFMTVANPVTELELTRRYR